MTDFFIEFFNGLDNVLGAEGVFVITLSILTLAFGVFFALCLVFKLAFLVKLRLILFFLSLIIFEYGLERFLTGGKYFPLTCAFFCAYSALIFSLPEKVKTATEQQKRLARYFDQKASEQKDVFKKERADDCEVIKLERQKEVESGLELDFSHVKNVIAKMEYYSLSPNDKRTVKELENALSQGERELTGEVKEKINDGLGALLKIMSKYGI